jgi:hypothetical protein
MTAMTAGPAESIPAPALTPRMLYALSIFAWTKGHPTSTSDDLIAMLERAEARAARLSHGRESG